MNISESTIQTKLNKKVDKIHGKGLSTNDFTDEYKNKVLSGTGGVGPQGEPGANGIDGTNGIDGINGTNGIDGTNGTDGYTPVKGVDYFDGIDGTNGSNGTNGTNGIDGYTPIKGVDYFDGADGTNGTNGTNGVDGADGAPGTTTWAGITDKPTIPTALADLSDDTTHRIVTDTEKSTWNSKQAGGTYSTDIHSNITALNAVSGTNTGNETSTTIKTALGITTLSGSNTGDNATNSQYSGLAASKQDDLGFTAVPNTRTVNTKALSANVVLTPDDLDDTSTTHKFVASADITKLSNLSGTNTGDQTLSSLGILKSQSATAQSSTFATDIYLAGSYIKFPVAPLVGTTYKLLFDVTKTNVGTATPTITIRLGTAGTTSDAITIALAFGAGTAAVDTGLFEVICTFRTVGSGTSAVVQSIARLTSNLATTGLSNAVKAKVGTSSGFNSTTSSLGIGASYNGGTSASHTVTLVRAELII